MVEALRPYSLTLQNYASIAEQQVGGFLQAVITRVAPDVRAPLCIGWRPWHRCECAAGRPNCEFGCGTLNCVWVHLLEQVVSIKLVTPARGLIELSADKEPELFAMARVAHLLPGEGGI